MTLYLPDVNIRHDCRNWHQTFFWFFYFLQLGEWDLIQNLQCSMSSMCKTLTSTHAYGSNPCPIFECSSWLGTWLHIITLFVCGVCTSRLQKSFTWVSAPLSECKGAHLKLLIGFGNCSIPWCLSLWKPKRIWCSRGLVMLHGFPSCHYSWWLIVSGTEFLAQFSVYFAVITHQICFI